ncbi:MAG: hypothetical protein U5L96_09620 [Owenweeksia sp.]|nr:hypothetical protein [Owenweeksia sp.]
MLISLISADEGVMPDALACLAASAALQLSDIPFGEPVAEVRIARIENNWIVNPSWPELQMADINLMVAGTHENIIMVEGEMREVSEEEMAEAIRKAHHYIQKLCENSSKSLQLKPVRNQSAKNATREQGYSSSGIFIPIL